MGVTRWLVTRWLRRRWIAAVPLAIIVAIGGAGTMTSLSASERTETAYARHLDASDAGDVVINPATSTREIDEVIRNLPGAEHVTMSALLLVSLEEGTPRLPPSPAEMDVIDETTTFALGSADGRYLDMDRPVVLDGRLPTGENEAAITRETAAGIGLAVGDVVPMSFWGFGVTDGMDDAELERYRTEIVAPLGVEHVTIVGEVVLSDEVLPEDLFTRQRILLSPDLAERYDCMPAEPSPGLTLAETVQLLIPEDCAYAQHYYSLSLADGAAGVQPALDEYLRTSAAMNERWNITDLGQVEGNPPWYYLIPTETQRDLDRVEAAIRPTVVALFVLGVTVGIVTTALTLLTGWREVQRTRHERHQWHQLGLARQTHAVVLAAPLLLGLVVGAATAVLIAWWLDAGAVGLVAPMEPEQGPRLTGLALAGMAAIGALTLGAIGALSVLNARTSTRASGSPSGASGRYGIAPRFRSPVLGEGTRAAWRSRTSIPVAVGAAVVTTAMAVALVFGAGLSALLSTPTSYGWPWDVAAVTGGGYGDLDLDRARQLLDDDVDVERWTSLAFTTEVSLDAEPTAALVAPGNGADAGLTLVDGTFPQSDGEIAIGAITADELGIDVGDTVTLSGFGSDWEAVVSGVVVLPTLGAFVSDRVSSGTGMLLPDSMFDRTELAHLRDFMSGSTAFVGVELRTGVDSGAAVSRLEPLLRGLDRFGVPAVTHTEPVRPAEIIDAHGRRSMTTSIGAVLAVSAVVGLAVVSWASVRARRREVAVLRTLGMTDGQVRGTVEVQSVATVLSALIVGVPVGTIAGRALWRAFARQLGVAPDPAAAVGSLALLVVGALAGSFVAALLPSWVATRTRPAAALRGE